MDPRDANNATFRRSPVRVLSLDGGGVRGLSSLLILEHFVEDLSRKLKKPSVLLPCDVFDLIVGTSTGGIIALMLGRLRMSVAECIREYMSLAEEVFGNSHLFRIATRRAMYSERTLEDVMKKVVARVKGNAHHPLVGRSGCRTAVVTALQDDVSRPILLRSYRDHPDARAIDCTIWEAARATSAAFLFFPPIAIGTPSRTYIDGALSGHCNPALLAKLEAQELWPTASISCLLSIGTGSPSVISTRGSLHATAKNLTKLFTECHSVHDMLERHYNTVPDPPYFRFSVKDELAHIRLDEWKQISPRGDGRLPSLTDSYMGMPDQRDRSRRCLTKFDVSIEDTI
jgi:predicted acylesterase/phospholipase RssA